MLDRKTVDSWFSGGYSRAERAPNIAEYFWPLKIPLEGSNYGDIAQCVMGDPTQLIL
jgi:hypothetical protein